MLVLSVDVEKDRGHDTSSVFSICYAHFQFHMLLFAMIRSVVKSFKDPDVEVVAARMCNEAALTRMTDSTPKTLVILDASPGWMS